MKLLILSLAFSCIVFVYVEASQPFTVQDLTNGKDLIDRICSKVAESPERINKAFECVSKELPNANLDGLKGCIPREGTLSDILKHTCTKSFPAEEENCLLRNIVPVMTSFNQIGLQESLRIITGCIKKLDRITSK